ncbi:30S ribosomal protein S14 [Candidatus Woesearchaeota archaeon CG1_02_57_44]|nr:MAG: 30S ribosomal protein S14 [Candidatus Woesearchaeota archaeon CG1_02_57_44]
MKHNSPKERSTGLSKRKCRRCQRTGAHIRSYGLHLCRHCFREIAPSIGFKKFN